MKILCIGDSMGLPRNGVSYSDTWIYMMKQAYPSCDFINCFARGMLMREAVNYYTSYYSHYDADCFIVQTGICDCAPRYINDKRLMWRFIIEVFKKLGIEFVFWRMIKMVFARKKNCVYTSKEEFRSEFTSLIGKLGGVKISLL